MTLHTLDLPAHRTAAHDPAANRATLRDLAALLKLDLPPGAVAGSDVDFCIRRVEEGQSLCRTGEAFRCVYAVRFGFFKTVMSSPEGTEQIVGFPMKGDVIGLDAMGTAAHGCEAIALEMSEVIAVPFDQVLQLAGRHPALLPPLLRLFGRELARENAVIFKLASMHAEARVAAFLLELAERYGALGYSRREFQLRMKRQEIGSYLGLKLETVSRTLSAFDTAKIISVRKKSIVIEDFARLHAVADGHAVCMPARPCKATAQPTPARYPAWQNYAPMGMAAA
ncbi:MAG: helix-turn-helix domain-containing protein [Betaproteobacteria bacterium]|nr:helix-turn-helix domain-containing protein [Betaproteobacteria bacterium]